MYLLVSLIMSVASIPQTKDGRKHFEKFINHEADLVKKKSQMLFSEDFIIACPIFPCENIKYCGNIEHDTTHHSRPEHKRSDRGFQFHGKQCGGSDKVDDTTQTNTTVSRKLHTAICGAFSFRNWCEERKKCKKKENLTHKIRITHRKVKHFILDHLMRFGSCPGFIITFSI